jgi:hypothetical protein
VLHPLEQPGLLTEPRHREEVGSGDAADAGAGGADDAADDAAGDVVGDESVTIPPRGGRWAPRGRRRGQRRRPAAEHLRDDPLDEGVGVGRPVSHAADDVVGDATGRLHHHARHLDLPDDVVDEGGQIELVDDPGDDGVEVEVGHDVVDEHGEVEIGEHPLE